MSSPIEDYALIGDGQTAALVHRNGSIDWLCWPRFDSDACFCALLGVDDNGRWSIAPSGPVVSTSRRYEEDTLVLETDVQTPDGTVRLTDFMPIRQGDLSAVIRMVEGLSGSVGMAMDLRLRFDYGSLPPWCEAASDGVTARIGSNQVVLEAPVPVAIEGDALTAAFTVSAGRRFAFVLAYSAVRDGASGVGRSSRKGLDPAHGARRDAPLLARLDRAFRYVENAVAGRSQAILDHATRHDPSGDGRPRGCADHQPSRGACRRLELGLSLLLAAGRDVHARCFRQCGLHR